MHQRVFEKDVVGMIVCSSDNRIVMGLKLPEQECNGPYPGYWVLPGGVVSKGDSFTQTVIDETLEETGLDLSAERMRIVDTTGSDEAEVLLHSGERVLYLMKFVIFQTQLDRPSYAIPLSGDGELDKLVWAQKTNLDKYNLCPPSKLLFHRIGFLPLNQL